MYNIKLVRQGAYSAIKKFPCTLVSKSKRISIESAVNNTRSYSVCRPLCVSNISPIFKQISSKQTIYNLKRDCIQDFINVRNIRSFSQKSTSSGDDGESTGPDDTAAGDGEYLMRQALPATVVVPEIWPHVPLIAVNRNPLFPRFIKFIDVSSSV